MDFYGKNVSSLEEVSGCESESPKINEASFIRGGANGVILISLIPPAHITSSDFFAIEVNNSSIIADQIKIQLSEAGGIGNGKRFAEVNCWKAGSLEIEIGIHRPPIDRAVS